MNVTVEETDTGSIRLCPHGYIDLDTVRRLRKRAETITLGPRVRLVLDLSGVEFMDSAGLTFLIWLRRRADASGAALDVVDARPAVAKVLRLTGIDVFLSTPPHSPPRQRGASWSS